MNKQIIPFGALLIAAYLLARYIDTYLHDNVIWTIQAALYIVVAALALALGGSSILFLLRFRESWLLAKATRRQAEKEADTHIVVSDVHGVFVRELNPKATWRPLHLNPAQYQNGGQAEVSPVELTTWEKWQALRSHRAVAAQVINPPLLPATTEAEQLDLLAVFTQPTQSYAIIGGQQTGKTFQAQHIANCWLRQGLKPAVIGPKWDRGEWGGCYLLGGNGDFQAVELGISLVRQLVERRHADTTRGHKQHSIQPIFFDDWTPIVDAVPNARALVLEATTLYASVNVILYFILHSDTANAWGVDRKGAALKDNFIKLFIYPQYDGQGQIIRSLTRGYIRFAGESVERPVKLFTTQPISMGQAVELRANPAGPDGTAALILDLKAQGKSNREISQAIWGPGKFGDFYNQKIEQVLSKYGEK